jgi:hypothetical protein
VKLSLFFCVVLERNQSGEDTRTQMLMCQAVVLVFAVPGTKAKPKKLLAGASRQSSGVE